MRALKPKMVLMGILLLLFAAAAGASAQAVELDPSQYYLASLGSLTADVQTLALSASAAGWIVMTSTLEDQEALDLDGMIFEPYSLPPAGESFVLLDGGEFYLRSASESYTYAVRPAADAYELVISPDEAVDLAEVLSVVLTDLAVFGVTGVDIDLELQAYPQDALKGPPPPEGMQIDSALYGLAVAEDWFAYAPSKGFQLVGLRIEVVAELLPDQEFPQAFEAYVIEQTEFVVKLLIPVGKLPSLAASTQIGYVRLPYRPAVP